MDIDKFSEEEKARVLYERERPQSLARDILDEWPQNARYTATMARLTLAYNQQVSCYRGNFKGCMDGVLDGIVTAYRGVDGWGIDRAIQAEGETVARDRQEAKNGFISRFGL